MKGNGLEQSRPSPLEPPFPHLRSRDTLPLLLDRLPRPQLASLGLPVVRRILGVADVHVGNLETVLVMWRRWRREDVQLAHEGTQVPVGAEAGCAPCDEAVFLQRYIGTVQAKDLRYVWLPEGGDPAYRGVVHTSSVDRVERGLRYTFCGRFYERMKNE